MGHGLLKLSSVTWEIAARLTPQRLLYNSQLVDASSADNFFSNLVLVWFSRDHNYVNQIQHGPVSQLKSCVFIYKSSRLWFFPPPDPSK